MPNNNHVTVIVLTSSGKDGSDTVNKIQQSCKKFGKKFYMVSTQYAYIDDRASTSEKIVIHNHDGSGKSITLDPRDVVCFARGGVTNTQIGMAILTIFENTGMFVINERRPMELCANKLYSAIQLDSYDIPTPKTAFVANLSSLDNALEQIGNQFPVIVKTLTGAEGVGVSIVDSYESLKSVLQTLWKYDAELLIQEYLEIKNDVRVLVLDGKVVAAAMRGKAPRDFRTNLAQGAEGGPYKISDQEREIAERAAEVFGTYYVGVDMVTSKGKPYVIELNASPGSGNVYRSYFPDSEGKNITGQKLIDSVVKHAINRENWNFNHREVGLIEPIDIDSIGKFKAKLDTGNESYNVLGAENIEEYNGTVAFTVQGKKYEKPVVSHVRIRTNNINVDRRPVVEFDVEFRNRKFKNIRFSLVPRRFNKYPVLIGNKFMNLAKISVNVNTIQTLPESNRNNQYIEKINTLGSFVQIDEMRDILAEKLQTCKKEDEAVLIEEALGHINVAKYNLKNQQQQAYDRNTIMYADKKFLKFLENFNNENSEKQNLNEEVVSEATRASSISQARKALAKISKKREALRKGKKQRKSRSVGVKIVKGKPKEKDYQRLDRAIQRKRAKSDREKGIVRKKKREKMGPAHVGAIEGASIPASREYSQSRRSQLERLYSRKKYKEKAPTEYNPEMASIRFWNYRTPTNPRRSDAGNPMQSGARASVVDGGIKQRFGRYYGNKKGKTKSRTGMTGEEIRSVVREKIRRGEWPSPGGMAGLRKGWEKTWMKKKKKD
jgi:ribosomal protein S6--L-glutamate ligase